MLVRIHTYSDILFSINTELIMKAAHKIVQNLCLTHSSPKLVP